MWIRWKFCVNSKVQNKYELCVHQKQSQKQKHFVHENIPCDTQWQVILYFKSFIKCNWVKKGWFWFLVFLYLSLLVVGRTWTSTGQIIISIGILSFKYNWRLNMGLNCVSPLIPRIFSIKTYSTIKVFFPMMFIIIFLNFFVRI